MALGAALVDRARVVRNVPAGRRVVGRTIRTPVEGEWFRARLSLGDSTQDLDEAGGRRNVRTPSLMFGIRDLAGDPIDMTGEDRVEVASAELGTELWDVVGDPKPMRKKRRVIGYTVTLRRVEVHEGEAA